MSVPRTTSKVDEIRAQEQAAAAARGGQQPKLGDELRAVIRVDGVMRFPERVYQRVLDESRATKRPLFEVLDAEFPELDAEERSAWLDFWTADRAHGDPSAWRDLLPNPIAEALNDQAKSGGNGTTEARKNGKPKSSIGRLPPPDALGHTPNVRPTDAGAGLQDKTRQPIDVETLDIPLGLIDTTPDNARRTYDQQKLQLLADQLKSQAGQLQPCRVRTHAKRYILIGGERRYRAAKMAGLATLRCEVVCADDQAARLAGLLDNWMREDLNPIERAIGLKQLLDDGKTQDQVGKLLGISQAEVSNTVRLLELPKELADKIADGKLNQSQAVALVPHARRPAWVKEFVKHANRDNWELGGARDIVEHIAATYGLTGTHVWTSLVPLAKEHAEKIDLVELETHWGGRMLYAMNRKAWQKIKTATDAAKTKERDEAEAKKASKSKPKGSKPGSKGSKGAKGKAQDGPGGIDDKDLCNYVRSWFARQVAAVVRKDPSSTFCAQCHLALLDDCEQFIGEGEDLLRRACAALKIRPPQIPRDASTDSLGSWLRLRAIKRPLLDRLAAEMVALALEDKWFGSYGGYENVRVIGAIAADAGIDFKVDWAPTKEFLELHSIDELEWLAVEWELVDEDWEPGAFGKLKHSEIVAELLESALAAKVGPPASLLKLAAPPKAKGKAKSKAKKK